MKKSRLVIALLFIGMLTITAYGQTPGDNTVFDVAWSDDDTSSFGAVWQGDVAQPGPFDFDGDGNIEFLTLLNDASWWEDKIEKSAVIALVEETATGFEIVWSYLWAPFGDFNLGGGQRGVAVGDLDGDGNPEIVVGLEAAPGLPDIWIFEASSAGIFPDFPTTTIFADQLGLAGTDPGHDEGRWSFEPSSAIVDLDGDGKEEYIASAASGVAIIELAGGTFTADPVWDVEYINTDPTGLMKAYSLTVTDLDQDGMKELVYASVGGSADWTPRFAILEATGADAYAIRVSLATADLPVDFGGSNGSAAEENFDNDSDNELYIADTHGSIWVLDTAGDLAAVDSNSFYLLNTFSSAGWAIGDVVAGNLDGTDGGDLYIAGGEARAVWDVEYVSGDVTDDVSYAYYTMIDTAKLNAAGLLATPADFQPHRLAIGGDGQLIVQSTNNSTGSPTMYVVEWGIGTGVIGEGGGLPYEYALKHSYPNPFNPETVIQYELRETGNVSIKIYNMNGQLVRTLVDELMNRGSYQTVWNGKADNGKVVSSGLYLTVMKAPNFKASTKITFLK